MSVDLKCIFLGDKKVGKTWLITTFITGENPSDDMPTIFDSFSCEVCIKNKDVSLSLWDTSGDLKYDRIRQLSYPNADCFFICYSTNSIRSFDNVKKWYKEIKDISINQDIPIILVGTKSDIKDDKQGNDIITEEMGEKLKKEMEFYDFIETSSLERKNLYTLFERALDYKMKKNRTFKQMLYEYCCFCCL
ncbi:Ras-related small GTPase, Rho type [Pseudoloma neurophilia]|uniref:Ras-related small GTPase, Rho type n=1 Tax=Pseudoloma neurophilia TaxID=146866 RepID=A0A0R0LXG0_9MICR|nr:Ras-related small GTPase, Rho type [Pseudoloma neurophilia]